jgi:hypothetical protein
MGLARPKSETNEPLLRAIGCAILVLGSVGMDSARADYRYVSGDPLAVQRSLIRDIQTQRLDTRNLDPRAVQGIYQGGPMSPRPDVLNALGPLAQVCLVFGIQYPNGRKLVFRTVHQNGCGDWVVTMSTNPEFVQGLTMLPRPKAKGPEECGPPAVLPLVPSGNETVMPPPKIDCTDANVPPRPATAEEQQDACTKWPQMCRR